jgi:hypothetical protein
MRIDAALTPGVPRGPDHRKSDSIRVRNVRTQSSATAARSRDQTDRAGHAHGSLLARRADSSLHILLHIYFVVL